MILSIIVAAAENNSIGHNNGLLCRLSGDLKHFKTLTSGHTVIMGRKTFESIGKPLPNRRNIVISHSNNYTATGCETANSIARALELVEEEDEVFIIGGGSIYREVWNQADRLYLTRIHSLIEGDTFIPGLDANEWMEVKRENFKADEKNEHDYSFIDYLRKS